jgi:hypothetical protein
VVVRYIDYRTAEKKNGNIFKIQLQNCTG